ncbi:hypothetical protein B484DRAFT_482617, partial [Ochromonadaceae sp. CCMP2298]
MKKSSAGTSAGTSTKKQQVVVKEKEDNWYISPCIGIPKYDSEKDPHCPSGQIRKFNEEKRLKARIIAEKDRSTQKFIRSTLNPSETSANAREFNSFAQQIRTRESHAEMEILQKIVVRENLLSELQRLLRSQNDVTAALAEVVELVKAIRFQTLDIVEDVKLWQKTQPREQGGGGGSGGVAFMFKGFNYLVKVRGDLDFLDSYDDIVERFGFEFRNNPLAYRGGGNVITGYEPTGRSGQGQGQGGQG